MLFSELTKGKQRCVLSLLECEPRLKTARKISRKDIVAVWENMKNKGSKVGFPNWLLTKTFKKEDGFYSIPKPTKKDIESYYNPPKRPKKKITTKKIAKKEKPISDIRKQFLSKTLPEEDMLYYATLDTYNIPF